MLAQWARSQRHRLTGCICCVTSFVMAQHAQRAQQAPTAARAHHEALQRGQPHGGVDRLAVLHRAHAAAGACGQARHAKRQKYSERMGVLHYAQAAACSCAPNLTATARLALLSNSSLFGPHADFLNLDKKSSHRSPRWQITRLVSDSGLPNICAAFWVRYL